MKICTDILPIINNNEIIFSEYYHQKSDIYTFIFKYEKNINWIAGQHGIFTISNIKGPIRPFTIASVSKDNYIEVTTRIGKEPSEFKTALLNLEKGSSIKMKGPVGGFYLRNKKPTVMIAKGIGITPFKALVKDILNCPEKKPEIAQLLYLGKEDEFIYQNVFDSAAKENWFDVKYLDEEANFTKYINEFALKHQNNANYFLAGAPKFVEKTEKKLKEIGIKNKYIIKDTFIGY